MGEEAELMVETIKEGATMPPTPGWSTAYKQRIEALEVERDALRETLVEIADSVYLKGDSLRWIARKALGRPE